MNPTPPPLLTPDSPAADHRPYTNPAGQTIAFQKGAMELGRNGWTTEELLNILVDHLDGFQQGKFACGENANALGFLKEARLWVQLRAFRRTQAGLKGRDGQHDEPVPTESILKFFGWQHLPEHLARVSRPFGILANTLEAILPRGAERAVALRKLLEGKDAAVRAALEQPSNEVAPAKSGKPEAGPC